jgi:SAM-dependent methyltransferase
MKEPQVRLLVIAVDPEHQEFGIGTQLLVATERLGSALSHKEIYLTVRRANIHGLRFYERNGWKVVKAVNSEQLEMRKTLAPPAHSDLPASLVNSLEIARVRAEYARRSRVIAQGHYELDRPANLYSNTQLQRELVCSLKRVHKFPLDGLTIADIGCGAGGRLVQCAAWGADGGSLYGIDLDDERVCRARRKLPGSTIVQGDASTLPWPDDHFDLVTQFTVLTSILEPSMKAAVAREMARVVKPDGVIVWYDIRLDNPMNSNIRAISAREVRALFPNCSVSLRSATLSPPLARRVVPLSWMVALALEKIPLLRTHYLAIIRKHRTDKDI